MKMNFQLEVDKEMVDDDIIIIILIPSRIKKGLIGKIGKSNLWKQS